MNSDTLMFKNVPCCRGAQRRGCDQQVSHRMPSSPSASKDCNGTLLPAVLSLLGIEEEASCDLGKIPPSTKEGDNDITPPSSRIFPLDSSISFIFPQIWG